MVKLSTKAKALMKRLMITEEYADTIGRNELKAAQELINVGLAVAIPKASGKGELALTCQGIDVVTSLYPAPPMTVEE